MLAFYHAIEYADDLRSFLKRNALLTSGARYEVEIRAASIVACNVRGKKLKDSIIWLSDFNMFSMWLANSKAS